MAGESNPPYRISQTKMVLDSRYATDSAAQSVGRNVVVVGAPHPFVTEVKRDEAARRIVEPAHRGNGRGRSVTSYVYRQSGLVNSVFTGLVVRSYQGG